MSIVSNDLSNNSEKHVKGCFTDDRDDALACRFFYWSNLLEKRYDVAIVNLSKEFYLSETVITQRLMKRQDFLKSLRMKDTTRRDLAKLYPHFNWN